MACFCNKSWGIGINIKENGHGGNYGYPEDKNPHLFYPDDECCTDQERAAWNEAKKTWTEANL